MYEPDLSTLFSTRVTFAITRHQFTNEVDRVLLQDCQTYVNTNNNTVVTSFGNITKDSNLDYTASYYAKIRGHLTTVDEKYYSNEEMRKMRMDAKKQNPH